MKQLAGTMFVRNGIQYDYCFMEAIESLLNLCDAVYVVDAGSNDGTLEMLKTIKSDKFNLIEMSERDWFSQKGKGRSKLCFFTDIAIDAAERDGYEYNFYCQADEVIHEKSFKEIRNACFLQYDAYMVSRINLWGSPYYQLDVTHDRLPCSKEVIRLAKTCYRSIGDAESLNVPSVNTYFTEAIRLYHMGFVRDREKMVDKSINMQENIFELGGHDPKLDDGPVFKPQLWFDFKKDLKLINEPLPKTVKKWAAKRVYKLN
jgi:glycosyltransferase involved in cell wall biosynthesis